jgi:hypothetical protein
MPSDPNAPIYGSSPPGLPSLASGSGSLAQSARLKQLNVARGIMFIVGVLTIVVNVGQFAMVDSMVDSQIDKEVAKLTQQGRIVDPLKLTAVKESAKRATQLAAIGLICIGVVYVVFGFVIKKFPVPVTIAGLVIYIGTAVVFAVLSPETAAQGVIVKIIVVVALIKAVQAAMAYQRQREAAAMSDFAGAGG